MLTPNGGMHVAATFPCKLGLPLPPICDSQISQTVAEMHSIIIIMLCIIDFLIVVVNRAKGYLNNLMLLTGTVFVVSTSLVTRRQ